METQEIHKIGPIPDKFGQQVQDALSAPERVSNLEGAREWFLSHSAGAVECCTCDRKKLCSSYPEAVAFFRPE